MLDFGPGKVCCGAILMLGLIFSPVLWMIFSIKFSARGFQREAPGQVLADALDRTSNWDTLAAGSCGTLRVKEGKIFLRGATEPVQDLRTQLEGWMAKGCFSQGELRFRNGFAYNGFVKFTLGPEGRVAAADKPRFTF